MVQIKRRNMIFVVFCVLFIFALFFRSCTAIIVDDLMEAFSVPTASLGLMASAFFYAYAAAQLPVGFLSDRIGVRNTVLCFGLLGVLGSILFAYSTSIGMATWARVLTGVGTAGIFIPSLKYLSLSYRPNEFAILTSVITAVGGLGFMFTGLPMALLVKKIGWRHSCSLPGAIMLLLILLAWYLMAHPVSDTNGEKVKEQQHSQEPVTSQPQGTTAFYHNRYFWSLGLWTLIVHGAFLSFMSLWGAAYLQDSFNISREIAGSHLMFISLGMIVGGLFWGTMSDRFFRARRPVIFLGTLGVLLIWVIILFSSAYPGLYYTSLLYFGVGFFSVVFLIALGCAKELFPASIAGTAMGAVNAFMFIGVALYQGISGYMLDYFLETETVLIAYRSIFILYVVSVVLALLLVFFIPETFPGKQKTSQFLEAS